MGRAAWIVPLVAGLVYLLYPARNVNYADDSLRWAYEITAVTVPLNSHHLYLYGMRWVWLFFHDVMYWPIDSARLLAVYASVCGAVGLFFLNRILSILRQKPLATLGTLMCAATVGYWSYSVVGDVYVPAIACMVMGLYALMRGVTSESVGPACGYMLWAVAAFVAMILHHQAFFVMVGGILPGVLLMKFPALMRRLAFAVGVPLVTGMAALALYAAVYITATPPQERHGLYRFASGYASSYAAYPDMKTVSWRNVVNMLAGETRAVIATNFLFKSESFARAVQHRFPYRHVYFYPYLVRKLSWGSVALVALSSAVVAVLAPILFAVGALRAVRDRGLACMLMLVAVPQALLFLWWEAISDEFWLWSLPIVVIMVVLGASRLPALGRRLIGTIVICLTISTLLGSQYLLADPGSDIDRVNKDYLPQIQPGDLLISIDEIISSARARRAQQQVPFRYVNLFMAAEKGRANDLEARAQGIHETVAAGGIVYVDPYVLRPPTSYLRLVETQRSDFGLEMAKVTSMLRGIETGRVKWLPLRATVDEFFAGPEWFLQ
jgi:hypothetical protein